MTVQVVDMVELIIPEVTHSYGGALRYGPTVVVTVDDTVFTCNTGTYAGGALRGRFEAQAAVLSGTVVFSNNTAFCCYAKASPAHTTTAHSSCVDIAYAEKAVSECCASNTYSDGTNSQSCTAELTCAGVIGADTSAVKLPEGSWRASITSTITYKCWNSDACIGGAATMSTDDHCAVGYKGPCKWSLCKTVITVMTVMLSLSVLYATNKLLITFQLSSILPFVVLLLFNVPTNITDCAVFASGYMSTIGYQCTRCKGAADKSTIALILPVATLLLLVCNYIINDLLKIETERANNTNCHNHKLRKVLQYAKKATLEETTYTTCGDAATDTICIYYWNTVSINL
jgi:hypothetical protein